MTRTRYYGTAEQPVSVKAGYAMMEQTYNDQGQLVMEAYFTSDGRPYHLKKGYAGFTVIYHEDGTSEKQYFRVP